MVGSGRAGPGRRLRFFTKIKLQSRFAATKHIRGRDGGEIKTVLFWNIRNGARTRGWQGSGATLVALIAATQLLSLLRISETKHYFLHQTLLRKWPL